MQAVNKNQLFLASCIALIFTSLTFAFRASLEGVWGSEFNINKEQVGWVFSPAFWGFTLAMVIGGPLCDVLGMKRLVGFAFIGHIAGAVIYIIAKDAPCYLSELFALVLEMEWWKQLAILLLYHYTLTIKQPC